MPVQVLFDEIVGHMRERIEFPEPGELEVIDRAAPTVSPEEYKPYDAKSDTDVPPLAAFGSDYRFHVTGLNKAADGFQQLKLNWLTLKNVARLLRLSAKKLVQISSPTKST